MHKTDTSRKPSSRGASRECCTDGPCDSGLRNLYFEGKRLTADSFRVEQDYLVERRRLLNRAIHGWGVVYGYALKPAPASDHRTGDGSGGLEIGPGLALDPCGRELLYTRAKTLKVAEAILLDEKGARMERPPEGSYEDYEQPHRKPHPDKHHSPPCWLLSAHYAEQLVGPQTISDPCSCARKEWDSVCETVRFSLRRVDCEECCQTFDCELQCGCGTGPCCGEERPEPYEAGREPHEPDTETHEPARNPVRRGGCQCLCEQLTGLSDIECGGLQEIDEPCGQVRIDLRHGVPLACVGLREGDCDDWLFDRRVEACGPRRLVKGNDTLFDLIRGCDLTRISAIGWATWHRAKHPIHWDEFRDSFSNGALPPRKGRELTYWVEFSRPVRKDTVRADCFSMTVIVPEDEAGWGEARRVPIIDVQTVDAPGLQPGLITRVTLVFDTGWVSDAIESRKRIFNQNETQVEIEIRGDYIVDCNGQTVDANAVGLLPAPTGNGTPGGTFVSSFRVRPRDSRPPAYDNTSRA